MQSIASLRIIRITGCVCVLVILTLLAYDLFVFVIGIHSIVSRGVPFRLHVDTTV